MTDNAPAKPRGAPATAAVPASPTPRQAVPTTPSTPSTKVPPHRLSFTDNLRNGPGSPRQRNPSLSQAAVQELMNNPPPNKQANPKFIGREWRDVKVGELVDAGDIRWAEIDSTVEEATLTLMKSPRSVVLVRDSTNTQLATHVFDFSHLNTYLLTVVGLAKPDGHQAALSKEIMNAAQRGDKIFLRQLKPLCNSEPLIQLQADSNLAQAIEILGSGIHRLLVTAEDGAVVGVMSQLRIMDFFWNEGINFPNIESLYPSVLRELGVGTHNPISVNSDEPLRKALGIMNDEGLTSIAVVDSGRNVVGNISTKDVRHLTTTSSAPLLDDTCMHFISVILNERGVEMGRDAFPVFYVNPHSTLAYTVAKLTSTRSHRMWVVESASPSGSIPNTPSLAPTTPMSSSFVHSQDSAASLSANPVIPASALPGARISGKLIGVISLTDILNIFAKSTGLQPSDPGEQRARRRRSSSSSVRPSIDAGRPSVR